MPRQPVFSNGTVVLCRLLAPRVELKCLCAAAAKGQTDLYDQTASATLYWLLGATPGGETLERSQAHSENFSLFQSLVRLNHIFRGVILWEGPNIVIVAIKGYCAV